MKRALLAAAAFIASTIAITPAYAAEAPDCVRQSVATTVLTGLEDKIVAGLIVNNDAALNQDWSTLRPALLACRAKYNWSEPAANLATQLTLTSIMKGAVQRTLIKEGVDPAILSSMYRDLPLDVRRQFLDPSTIDAASLVFAQRMAARGIKPAEGVQRHIGMLLAALALLEFRPAEFAAA